MSPVPLKEMFSRTSSGWMPQKQRFHLKFHCSLWVAILRVCVCVSFELCLGNLFGGKNFRAWWTSWKITKWIRPRHAEIAFSKEKTDNKVNLICRLKVLFNRFDKWILHEWCLYAGLISDLNRLVYLTQSTFVPVKHSEPSPASLIHPLDV